MATAPDGIAGPREGDRYVLPGGCAFGTRSGEVAVARAVPGQYVSWEGEGQRGSSARDRFLERAAPAGGARPDAR
jgi:hypothetical protein